MTGYPGLAAATAYLAGIRGAVVPLQVALGASLAPGSRVSHILAFPDSA